MKVLEKTLAELFDDNAGSLVNSKGVEFYYNNTLPEFNVFLSSPLPIPILYQVNCSVEVSCDYKTIVDFIEDFKIRKVNDVDTICTDDLLSRYDNGNGRMFCIVKDRTFWYHKYVPSTKGPSCFVITGDVDSPLFCDLSLKNPVDFINHAKTLLKED